MTESDSMGFPFLRIRGGPLVEYRIGLRERASLAPQAGGMHLYVEKWVAQFPGDAPVLQRPEHERRVECDPPRVTACVRDRVMLDVAVADLQALGWVGLSDLPLDDLRSFVNDLVEM